MSNQKQNHKFMLDRVLERLSMAKRRLETELGLLGNGTDEKAVGLILLNTVTGLVNEIMEDYPRSFQSIASEPRLIGLIESLDRHHDSLNWAITYLENRRIQKMQNQYPRNTLGHVLQALRDYGIPETIAGSVTVGDGTIMYGSKPFASYKYFEGIENPLFRFQNQAYMQQVFQIGDNNVVKPKFRLTLSVHGTPGFEISGLNATPELHDLIRNRLLTNYMPEKGYKLSQEAGAFFQGGSHDREGQWIYIEFWKSNGAQAWLDYLNELYVVPSEKKVEMEQRKYDASWTAHVVAYVIGEDTYVACTPTKMEVRTLGSVMIEEDQVVSFHFEEGGTEIFNPPLLPHKE